MQLVLVLLSLLLLTVALFALQNAVPVAVRFAVWRIEASVAIVTLAATGIGVLIGGLLGLVIRLRRWSRSRPGPVQTQAAPPVRPGPSPPVIGPPSHPAP